MAVIFGVLHMGFGIFIKGLNNVYFREYIALITECIAGFIILYGIFGWMNVMIIAKYFKQVDIDDLTTAELSDYDKFALEKLESDEVHPPAYLAELRNSKMPSIISILITSIFSPGTCPEDQQDLVPPIGSDMCSLYSINLVLLIFVVIAVPAMLCTMPCLALAGGSKDSEAN